MGLLLVALAGLGLCAASFWLGRKSVPVRPATSNPTTLSASDAPIEEVGDLEEDLTFFDRLEVAPELSAQGAERTVLPPSEASAQEEEAAPTHEPSPGPPATEPPAGPVGQDLPAAVGGPFHVQVLATTEHAGAEAMVGRLRAHGFAARLEEAQRGGMVIYRVRVGGYPDEEGARRVAQAIERREGLKTWVTQ